MKPSWLGMKLSDSGMNSSPQKTIPKVTIHWKSDIPRICLTIFLEMIYSSLDCGGLASSLALFGGSVARANEPRESMIRFTHKSWIGWSGDSVRRQEPKKAVAKATTLTVS